MVANIDFTLPCQR